MRMKSPLAALFMAAALLAPAATRASDQPAWSVSLLGGYSQFSDKFFYPSDSLADAPVAGFRFGRAFGNWWTLEGTASAGSTHGLKRGGGDGPDVVLLNGSGSLVAQITPPNQLGALYLSGGFGYNRYKSDKVKDDVHYGVLEGAVGWKKWFNSGVGLRLEARNLLNMPNKKFTNADKSDQQYWGGIVFGWGGKPKDTDGDGVPDNKDKCPGTPKGATVNLTGCPMDSDGDGVWDGLDQCPNTPKGATVDAKGCPTDSDGDGVWDGIDQCSDTPKGATVDTKGCPMDSDGDGVLDGLDQCANTPKGATVDTKGCPMDTDGDGVPDGLDKCPDTAAGLKVDASGCPIEVKEKETELLDTGMIRLQNVNFDTGKAILLPESYAALDEVGAILLKWPQLLIEIGGHTDSRGTAIKNQVLSENRAQAVKDYLVDKFPALVAGQLSVKGYGFSRPIARNTTALNMAKNRRVEFKVLNRDALKKEIERRRLLKK
ncbi:MAG TPA: OmpA family protein [Candidatus Eisenbacteria bacterium]|jgi:outer membrane protein OmpA-like peptidoglycan-associated protein